MKTVIIDGVEHKDACDECGIHQAMHTGERDLCCKCHIKNGGIPADWHTNCMMEEMGNKVYE